MRKRKNLLFEVRMLRVKKMRHEEDEPTDSENRSGQARSSHTTCSFERESEEELKFDDDAQA